MKLKSWLRPLGPTVPYLNINLISCFLRYSWLARPAFNTATFMSSSVFILPGDWCGRVRGRLCLTSRFFSCKSSIPYSQFLRLCKICNDDADFDIDFDIEAAKMETFFTARGYPNDLIRKGRERALTKSRAEIFKSDAANNIAKDRVPFVTTFHPSNLVVEKIISRNFQILREESRTSKIFNKPPQKAFRCAENLKDLLLRNSLRRNQAKGNCNVLFQTVRSSWKINS